MKGAAGAVLLAIAGLLPMLELRAEPARSAGAARLEPISFDNLVGWAGDDHAIALRVFRRSCEMILRDAEPLRPANPPTPELRSACRIALAMPSDTSAMEARRFFETWFEPFHVALPASQGFLTGYFEPEFDGSLTPAPGFQAPLLARPDDLVTVPQGGPLPSLDPDLQAAHRTGAGFEPYPDRAAIADGALGDLARPIAFLRDEVDAFVIHVQGSARIRLPDGGVRRVAYAGRNGRPYTSIGRILVETGHIPIAEMSLERLTAWLRAHPEEGRRIMRQNRSYIFFRIAEELEAADGPIGGAGVPLTPDRSLAVDRTIWSYGLPFWLEGDLPLAAGGVEPLRRLMIAQDTGTAIVGPARGDVYFGTGRDAGTRAGLLRHPARFVVLRPKPAL